MLSEKARPKKIKDGCLMRENLVRKDMEQAEIFNVLLL